MIMTIIIILIIFIYKVPFPTRVHSSFHKLQLLTTITTNRVYKYHICNDSGRYKLLITHRRARTHTHTHAHT